MSSPVPARVAALVVTYDSADDVGPCLEHLQRASSTPLHTVVLDNASRDDTVQRLRALEVPVVENRENVGFARGCNLAASEAPPTEFLLLLNPDARLRPGAVDALLAAADRHPDAGIVGARILTPDGDLDPSSALGRMTLWSTACFGLGLSTLFAHHALLDPESLGDWQRDTDREVPVVPGTAALVRRAAWDQVGGFDPVYVMYSEDVDLCARLAEHGWSCRLAPDAVAEHRSGGSSSEGGKLVLLLRGRVTFARRHFGPLSASVARALLLLGVWLRAVGPAGLVDRLRPGRRRPQTSAGGWQYAWEARADWRDGWQSGPALSASRSRRDAA